MVVKMIILRLLGSSDDKEKEKIGVARPDPLCGGRGDPHPLWRSSLVEPGAKVTVIVFTEETWWPSGNTLSECFNNVDVGVPLWLTEPRDKHPRQEFAFSYPAL